MSMPLTAAPDLRRTFPKRRCPEAIRFEPLVCAPEYQVHDPLNQPNLSESQPDFARRIERVAAGYLAGNPLFIQSANLRGPFDAGWQNPWRTPPPSPSDPEDSAAKVQTSDLNQGNLADRPVSATQCANQLQYITQGDCAIDSGSASAEIRAGKAIPPRNLKLPQDADANRRLRKYTQPNSWTSSNVTTNIQAQNSEALPRSIVSRRQVHGPDVSVLIPNFTAANHVSPDVQRQTLAEGGEVLPSPTSPSVVPPRMAPTTSLKTVSDKRCCTTCSTTESKVWRNGPDGARTLCASCGAKWTHLKKKQQKQKEAKHAKDTAELRAQSLHLTPKAANGRETSNMDQIRTAIFGQRPGRFENMLLVESRALDLREQPSPNLQKWALYCMPGPASNPVQSEGRQLLSPRKRLKAVAVVYDETIGSGNHQRRPRARRVVDFDTPSAKVSRSKAGDNDARKGPNKTTQRPSKPAPVPIELQDHGQCTQVAMEDALEALQDELRTSKARQVGCTIADGDETRTTDPILPRIPQQEFAKLSTSAWDPVSTQELFQGSATSCTQSPALEVSGGQQGLGEMSQPAEETTSAHEDNMSWPRFKSSLGSFAETMREGQGSQSIDVDTVVKQAEAFLGSWRIQSPSQTVSMAS